MSVDDDVYEEIAELIFMLFDAFGRTRTESTVEAWAIALSGLSIDQVRVGITRAMAECEQLPAPVVVRRFATGSSDQEASKAWEIAVQAVSKVGYVKGVNFEDATINATIRGMGGWPAFCSSFERESEVWIRKRFNEVYASWVSRVDAESGAPLHGAGEVAKLVAIPCTGYLIANRPAGFIAGATQPAIEGVVENQAPRNGKPRAQPDFVESESETMARSAQFRSEIGEVEIDRRRHEFLRRLENADSE